MLLLDIMLIAVVIYSKIKVCSCFKCPEKQNTCNDGDNIVAFCVRSKEENDYCDKDLLGQIYEYPQTCEPTQCPARIKDYCAVNPCKNGGKCKNFPGSYSCSCQLGYHGRDCTIQDDQAFNNNIFFIYEPIVGWKHQGSEQQVVRSKAMIFMKSVGKNTSIVFTTGCSAKVKIYKKKDVRIEKTAREKCEIEFEENETIKKLFCQYTPTDKMPYFKLYFDIAFDNTNEPPGSIVTTYNREAQINLAGFKVTKLTLAVYNEGVEEFKESFTQINILQRATGSECLSPVNLVVSGMRCIKPLKKRKNEKISIKSVFDTQTKFESGLVCSYLYPVYTWETFNFRKTSFKPTPPKAYLPSKNCSQFDSDDHHCHESFEIKPFELGFGLYEIKLTVNAVVKRTFGETTLEAFPFKTFGLYFVEIEESPLIAIIEGGDSRTISESDSPVIVDGSCSHDPNSPPDMQHHLHWTWSCGGIASKCCRDDYGKICKVVQKLVRGIEYKFTLTLTSAGLSSQATQTITVSNKPQLQLEIRCLKNCGFDGFKTNPRETVYMEVHSEGKIIDKTKNPGMKFLWKYSCESKTTMKNTNYIKQVDVKSHILIVKEDKLTPGSECKFTVEVDSSVEQVEGSSSIVMLINKPPDKVECNITSECTPDKCYKARAKFTISCSGFNDTESQLVYSFYQTKGQVSPGTLLGFSMCGQLNNVLLTEEKVIVRVSDQFGMFTDFETKVQVKFQDWTPNEKEINEMMKDLETYVLSRDSSSSAMLAGAMLDVIDFHRKIDILENVLEILSKDFVNDLSDVKLYTSTLKKIVTKGIKESKMQLSSKVVELLGAMMDELSRQLLLEVNLSTKQFTAVPDREIWDTVLTMVETADAIAASEDETALDVRTSGTLAVLVRTNQYKIGTASMVRSLVLSGKAVLDNLLPHQRHVLITSGNITMWAKVEKPSILANHSIPEASSTQIKMSKKFGDKLQRLSENVALQVIIFTNNPYWWDVEDRDVASEVISVATYRQLDRQLTVSDDNMITNVAEDLDVYLKLKTTRSETVEGSVTMPLASALDDEKDAAVKVLTLVGPPENSNGMLFVEFTNLESNELQVLLTENIRPDYQMMEKSQKVNTKSPLLSLAYNNITADTLHFIGILPGTQISEGHSVNYTMNIYSIQCKIRQQTVWTSPSCKVGEETTKDKVHCKCSHMSFFGSSIFVAPHTVHPINDMKLLLTVKNNPAVFMVVLIILIAYVILLVWALLKDKRNKTKRQFIILDDNFPGESYSYLVVVYTSFNYGSGTDANVGIRIIGSNGSSRNHILRSPKRRVFRRNSDDWFLIFTRTSLRDLMAIYLWHDNSGSHPDWFCQKVVVYDVQKGTEYTFIVEQWLSVRPGEFTETVVVPAGRQEKFQWNRVIMHNILYNLREKHLWLSIYMSHPRATVTKSQRVTIAFCVFLITLLTGIMFYGVARDGVESDDPEYKFKMREFIIAVQSVVISTLATAPVVICFRRSQIVALQQSVKEESLIEIESLTDLTRIQTAKGACFRNLMSKMVRGKPLIPVVVGKETAKSVIVRRRWAICGWVMSQMVVWGSGYMIILYGLRLGRVISELWLTSAGLSISVGALLNSPVKIIFVSMILSLFGEMYNVTTYEYNANRPLKEELFGNAKYLESLLKLRSSSMYKPLQTEQIAEYRKAALRHLKIVERTDFLLSVVLLLTLLYMSGSPGEERGYYITSHIRHSLVVSHGPLAVPLENVINMKKLTDYLISKLFPGLYKEKWYNKRSKLTSPAESLPKMGWFSDTVHRMVGIPRMRQLRAKFDNCTWVDYFNVSNVVCVFGLRASTEDSQTYGLHWGETSKDINMPLLAPWTYQHDGEHTTKVYGDSGVPYHTGGYVVDLYETQDKCNNEISDLIDLEWWDVRTRAFIVELTLYNPNTDMYSLVTLITEHLPSGAFTNRIHVTLIHLGTNLFWTTLYLGILILFNINLFLEINRRGVILSLSRGWGCYEILFVGVSDAAIIFQLLKTIKMSTAVSVFQDTGSSGFFFFPQLVWYEKTAINVWITVLCLTPIRLLKFKPFVSALKTVFFSLYRTKKLLLGVSSLILFSILIQNYMINSKISPETLPFATDSKFYIGSKKESVDSSPGCHQFVTSLLHSIVSGVAIVLFKVLLVNAYKK